jgi:hypothetical protein
MLHRATGFANWSRSAEKTGRIQSVKRRRAVSHRFARRLSLSSIHAIAPTPKRITHPQAICASCLRVSPTTPELPTL